MYKTDGSTVTVFHVPWYLQLVTCSLAFQSGNGTEDLSDDSVSIFLPLFCNALEDGGEAGATVGVPGGKVGSPHERFEFGG